MYSVWVPDMSREHEYSLKHPLNVSATDLDFDVGVAASPIVLAVLIAVATEGDQPRMR